MERLEENFVSPTIPDEEVVNALLGWGVDLRPNKPVRENTASKQEAGLFQKEIKSERSNARSGTDLGRKDVRLGRTLG